MNINYNVKFILQKKSVYFIAIVIDIAIAIDF